MKHQPRYEQNQPSDPDKDRQATKKATAERADLMAKLRGLGIEVPKPHSWILYQLHFLYHLLQSRTKPAPCDECNVLRLQLQDARDRLDEIHRTLSNLDKLTSIKQPLQRFPAVGTPIPVQADYANRLITLGELTGASMADLMDQARDLVRDYRLGDSFALAAVEAMHGFTWSEGRYVPYEQ